MELPVLRSFRRIITPSRSFLYCGCCVVVIPQTVQNYNSQPWGTIAIAAPEVKGAT